MKNYLLNQYKEEVRNNKLNKDLSLYTKMLVTTLFLAFAVFTATAKNTEITPVSSAFEICKSQNSNVLLTANEIHHFTAQLKGGQMNLNTYKGEITINLLSIVADKKTLLPSSSAYQLAENNHVIFWHNGFKEEYINNLWGLRQNFIINQELRANQIKLMLSVYGATPVLKNKTTILLNGEDGPILEYANLYVYDALGKPFNAHFNVTQNVIEIVVENTANAVYPITIDPISTTPDWHGEINMANARFGSNLATAGDVNGDGYDDVIIGAYGYNNGQTNEGAAFVYFGSSTGLSASPNWQFESNQANAGLGRVASAGDVNGDGYDDVILGATTFTNGQSREGKAYVFYGSATGLSATPDWEYEGNIANARFGDPVSSAGDVNGDGYDDIIVGAVEQGNYSGAAYLFLGSNAGLGNTPVWQVHGASIAISAGALGTGMSAAGDINGDGYDDVVIGEQNYPNGATSKGRVFIYHGSATGLAATANLIITESQVGAVFGVSSSSAGDVNGDGYDDVIIGAYSFDNSQANEGKASLYLGSSTGLNPIAVWHVYGNQANAYLGYRVSGLGDVNNDGYDDVIVGAYGYSNGEANEGRALVYYGSSTGLDTVPDLDYESNQVGAHFGLGVSRAGDVNGDGADDILVGAELYDNGQTNEGATFLFFGDPNNIGINESNRNLTNVYFSNNMLRFNSASMAEKNVTIRIVDMAGRILFNKEVTLTNDEQIIEFNFKSGIYVVQLYNQRLTYYQTTKLYCSHK